MPKHSAKIILLLLVFAGLLGGWIFFHRVTPVAMEKNVPASALGYLAINNVPQLLDDFAATKVWQELAPAYGLDKKINYAGWAAKLARWTGVGTKETLLIARSQFALVITGIEVRGEEVKPRWALIAETHGSEAQIQSLIADRLSQLAKRAYRDPIQESSDYAGVPVTIYRAPQGERQILSASVNGEWILANDPEALRQCIDVRQGRIPAMAQAEKLAEARTAIAASDNVFAFVNQAGAARLAKFFAHVAAGKVLTGTPVAGLLEGLVEEISANSLEAIAYSAHFANGGVQEKSVLLCKPDIAASLQNALRIASPQIWENNTALKLVPAEAESIQLTNIEDPNRALDEIEKIISSHIGVAQSFLFHRVFTTAKKTFLGIDQNDNASQAIGNQVLRFNFPSPDLTDKTERVWLVEARNQAALTQIARRLVAPANQTIKQEVYQNVTLHAAPDEKNAFTFLQNILVLGSTKNLKQFLDAYESKAWLHTQKSFTTLNRDHLNAESILYSFSSDVLAIRQMMEALQRRTTKSAAPPKQIEAQFETLPMATTFAASTERGILVESRSVLGNFPAVVNFLNTLF